jgi:2-polyprenyl-3-methyl-5-hydroxy-6-metoxy-1,4-benzoquinol methylase
MKRMREDRSPSTDERAARAERIAALGFDYSSQEMTSILACNLCGADPSAWTILTHRDRYGFPARTTACTRCGLVMLNPRMTAAAYARFYDGDYRPLVSAYHGRRIDARTIQAEQREYATELDRLLGPYLQGREAGGPLPGAEFLDVGGSTGVVAAYLARRYGLRPTVIDPAPEETAEAEALGVRTIAGLVEEWDPGDQRFDVIGMFQTVDHLLDIQATFSRLRSILHPEGAFIVDIVDFRAVYLKNWELEAAVKIDHPYSLTEATIQAYLARAGFEAIRKATAADSCHVVYLCRPSVPVPTALPPADWVAAFLRECRFVQNTPGGSGADRPAPAFAPGPKSR